MDGWMDTPCYDYWRTTTAEKLQSTKMHYELRQNFCGSCKSLRGRWKTGKENTSGLRPRRKVKLAGVPDCPGPHKIDEMIGQHLEILDLRK